MNSAFTIKNRHKELSLFKRRLVIALIFIILFAFLLFARLFYLQLIHNQHYQTLSKQNEIDIIPLEPRRGLIYDRNGVLLAKNVPVFSLMIVPKKTNDLDGTIASLKKIIFFSENDLEQFHKQLKQHRRFEQIPLKIKLTENEVAKFAVNRYQFPGVSVKAQLLRKYPFDQNFAHILGYVGRINAEELTQLDSSDYAATNFIGKVGIEKYYESELHGQVGYEKVETDASGEIIRTLDHTPPIHGKDLYLTIDSQLQIAAKKALNGKAGSVVAIEPSTGQVLALVSEPSYNPNAFVNGIDHKSFMQLQKNTKHPLYNRSIRGLYAPGSTIKPFIALEGLNSGVTHIHSKIYDPGWYKVPHTKHIFHDWAWRSGGRGWVDLTESIIQSDDIYFYTLAYKLGINRIDDILLQFGFGRASGINMGEELGGNVPTPEWKLLNRGKPWYSGDTVLTGIGQSYMEVTPLQLAAATAILANRGTRAKPTLLLATKDSEANMQFSQPVEQAPVILTRPEYWHTVLTAMQKVITEGTGHRFGIPRGYTVAAKTGTAQIYSKQRYKIDKKKDIPEYLRNNSIFIAFAPFNNPKIAIAVVAEHTTDAPAIARKVLDYYLLKENHASLQIAESTKA